MSFWCFVQDMSNKNHTTTLGGSRVFSTFHSLRPLGQLYSPKCLLLITPKSFAGPLIIHRRHTVCTSDKPLLQDGLPGEIPGPRAVKPPALDTMGEGGSNRKFRQSSRASGWKLTWNPLSVG